MKILGKEFEVDFYDADTMEKIEAGIDVVNEKIKKTDLKKVQKSSAVIRKVCNIIFEFFNSFLGENASKEIFGEKTSLTLCIKAYEDLINEKKKTENEFEEISKKYSTNRVTRRARK